MRKSFIKTLIGLAEKDKDIFLLTGDLGFHALEEFQQKFPERFLNCGIAEQSMMGIAAGLALAGKKPYVYSIVPFVTLRCLEQIRNDVCYQNLNVKIWGVGGGFSYGTLGPTHSVMEDMAALRAFPNMSVFSPCDPLEAQALLLKAYKTEGPAYFRLSNAGEYKAYDNLPDIEIGKPQKIKDGKEAAVFATGLMVPLCLELLKDAKILSLHSLKPINKQALLSEIEGFDKVFVFEEHSVTGGAGSALAEILAESDYKGSFKRIGMGDEFAKEVGKADYLRKRYIIKKDELKNIWKSVL